MTYLGTNAYLLEGGGVTLLLDPYFTRASLLRVALNLPLRTNERRLREGMARLPSRVDLILATHGHLDHLLDTPELARRAGAELVASPSSCFIAQAAGLPARRTSPMLASPERASGKTARGVLRRRGVTIRALPASHDKVFGREPFPGVATSVPPRPPQRPSDWKCGEPLAFLIEMNGRRIYFDSGGRRDTLPPAGIGPIDLAIIGVALPDSQHRFADVIRTLRPRYVLPSHQDNFFTPLDRGFRFGPLTDASRVRRDWAALPEPRGRLILLDYFQPWTLR